MDTPERRKRDTARKEVAEETGVLLEQNLFDGNTMILSHIR